MDGFDPAQRNFVRGEGNYLIDADGHRVFDAVSSIWTTIHGHCRPEIVEAIAGQAATLDHATLLGARNPLAEELAEKLARLLNLDHIFYASDGASAVEAALKMTLGFWQSGGHPERTRFIRLVDAYHGDTAGAMSVSGIELFRSRFGAITFESRVYDGNDDGLRGPDVAAVIVEPIVQAAAGMRIVNRSLYDPLRDMEPLLIVDEIATGFGRTGTMFAHEQLELKPDIVCLGKGLSGGTLPLSATAATARVFTAFLGAPDAQKQFFHGHSYAGNPIACAAALANLAIFESDRTLQHVGDLNTKLDDALEPLRKHPRVRQVRRAGLMIGIEIDRDPKELVNVMYARGHFTRPIGTTVQLVPPLTSSLAEIEHFIQDFVAAL